MLDAGNHHGFASLQASGEDGAVFAECGKLNRLAAQLVVFDNPDKVRLAVVAHGGQGNTNSRRRVGFADADLGGHAQAQLGWRIEQSDACRVTAGLAVGHGAQFAQLARNDRVGVDPEFDRKLLGQTHGFTLAFRDGDQNLPLALPGKAQHGLAGGDDLSAIDQNRADDTGKIATQFAIGGLVAGQCVLCQGLLMAGLGGIEGVLTLVECGLTDEAAGQEVGVAIPLGPGGGQFTFGGGQLRFCGSGLQLEVFGVESQQRLAGMDFASNVDQACLYFAAHPESQVDLVSGADFPGQYDFLFWCVFGNMHHNGACIVSGGGGWVAGTQKGRKQDKGNRQGRAHGVSEAVAKGMQDDNEREVIKASSKLGFAGTAMMPTHANFAGLDLLASAVLLIDETQCIRYLNPAGENLLAISSRSVIGRRLTDICQCSTTLQAAIANGLANNWGYTGQNIALGRADGEMLHLNCTVTPLRPDIAAGMRLLLELQPIQHHLAATREERLLEQQQANRELIRNLAHEIKNPLGGIRGAAQLLEHELGNPALKEYTQVIIKEADRLQDLMQRLLTPHRAMFPSTVNIHEILERVRSLLTAEFSDGLLVLRDYDTSLPELVGDREQLIQAVLNIARNAAQAMNGRGEIIMRTRSLRQVTLAKKRYRLAIEIKVIDNGPGIPDEIRERMFYPLVSGREGGSGLGLTIAQNFIQHHHGSIDCHSRPGQTVFTLRLPVEPA